MNKDDNFVTILRGAAKGSPGGQVRIKGGGGAASQFIPQLYEKQLRSAMVQPSFFNEMLEKEREAEALRDKEWRFDDDD